MPPLRLTRQQIIEKTTRDIRLRTEARQAQLRSVVLGTETDEVDSEDEGPPTCDVGLRRQAHLSVCVKFLCFLLVLLLLLSLHIVHHATQKTNKTI